MHAAEAVVNAQVHRRRRLPTRARSRAYTRSRPRTGSGRHAPSGSRTAMRSSIKLSVSLFSILPLIFLPERLLSTTDQGTDRSGIQFEGGSEFGVAETVAAQKQQSRLAPAESGENAADLLLLLCCGVRFLRVRWRLRQLRAAIHSAGGDFVCAAHRVRCEPRPDKASHRLSLPARLDSARVSKRPQPPVPPRGPGLRRLGQ